MQFSLILPAKMACERKKLGPFYAEKSWSVYKGHPPTQATLGQPIARVAGATGEIPRSLATLAPRSNPGHRNPTSYAGWPANFLSFPYKSWRNVFIRNKK